MEKQQFVQSESDPCLFSNHLKNGNKIVVACYVDDGLIAGTDRTDVERFIECLKAEFEIKVQTPDCYLGIAIKRSDDGKITLEKAYAEKLLDKFGMTDCNPVRKPAETGGQTVKREGNPLDRTTPYREAVGSLIFLVSGTRPDLAYAVSTVLASESKVPDIWCYQCKALMERFMIIFITGIAEKQ